MNPCSAAEKRRACHWSSVVAVVLLVASIPSAAAAQVEARTGRIAPNEAGLALAGNMLVGAVTAAAGALFNGGDLPRALRVGAFGGAIHFVGKVLGSAHGGPSGLLGGAVADLGSSVVANAGRARSAFDSISFALGPGRLRLAPGSGRMPRLTLNLYEAVILGYVVSRREYRLNWSHSVSHGTLVFETREPWLLEHEGIAANGATVGSVVVVSRAAPNMRLTLDHERTHAYQERFLQESWGRPLEQKMRVTVPQLRRLPSWLELGIVLPSMLFIERKAFGPGRGPLVRLMEWEAERFERE